MKTAFCFSGELRSLDKAFPRIEKNILSKFSDVDFFFFTWNDDPDLSKRTIIEDYCNNNNKTLVFGTSDPQTLDEKNYNSHKRPEVFIQRMLRQLYCLKECNLLKKQYEKEHNFVYDCVVRIRPDILPLKNSFIEDDVESWDFDNYLYTSDHDDWFGYNDRFYFSNSKNMDFLCERLDGIDDYFIEGNIMHYETYFKYCVDKLGLKVARTDLEFFLLRTDDTVASELTRKYTITKENIWNI